MVHFAAFASRTAVALLLATAISLIAACSEPTEEPTQLPPATIPMPEETAEPDATPTTTLPQLPTPTFTPVPVRDLDVGEQTTLGDVLAGFSEEEIACLRDAVGPETFEAAMKIPLAMAPTGSASLPVECLNPDHAVDIGVELVSDEAGGLSRASRHCIREVAVESPGVLGIGEPAADRSADAGATIRLHLCLSDEESEALSISRGTDLPPPSGLRCMQERLGGPDALIEILSADEPDQAAALSLVGAALACDTKTSAPDG